MYAGIVFATGFLSGMIFTLLLATILTSLGLDRD